MRNYLINGSPTILLLGCGVLTIGTGAFFAGWLLKSGGPNVSVTIFNLSACVSSAFHFAGITLFKWEKTIPEVKPVGRRRKLLLGYGSVIIFVILTSIAVESSLLPLFFIQGTGSTLIRQIILSISIILFSISVLFLMHRFFIKSIKFFYWYSLALALVAIDLFGVFHLQSVGSLAGWIGRVALYLSSIYFLGAVVSALRDAKTHGILPDEALSEAFTQSVVYWNDVLATVSDAVISCNERWRILLWNPAAEKLFGYTQEEAIGRCIDIILPDMSFANAGNPLNTAKLDALREIEFINRNGVSFSGETSFSVSELPVGKVITLLVRDITERKCAEDDLHRQTELLIAVAENTKSQLVYLDRDFNFLWVNTAYAKATGKKHEDLIGHNHFELYPNVENQAIFEHTRDTGIPFEIIEKPFIFPDHSEWGTTYWNWSLTPIKDSEGVTQSFVFSLIDVTNDVLARQEIQRLGNEANQRAAELEAFTSHTVDGMGLVDTHGRVVWMNEAGKRILNVPPDEDFSDWISRYQRLYLDGREIPSGDSVILKALCGETIKDFRYKVLTPSNKEIIISVSAAPICDNDENIIGATFINRDASVEVELEQQRIILYEREHRIAQVLQDAIIPLEVHVNIPGYNIAVRYRSALVEAHIGGDFYDVFELDNGKLAVLIGDVVGKGLPAAIHVASVRHSIRSYAYIDSVPSNVITLANEALCRETMEELKMLTALYMVIDIESGAVTYASAGHEPPFICGIDGRYKDVEYGGVPIGVMRGMVYSQAHNHLDLGDTVVLVTDGITEARTSGSHLFGEDRVRELILKHRSESPDVIADKIMDTATDFAGGQLQDDAVIVVLKRDI
ncbi:MAG: SpoIIE family protein phosphatase [Armatimonadota bacterium]